jgi:hypothetical protein
MRFLLYNQLLTAKTIVYESLPQSSREMQEAVAVPEKADPTAKSRSAIEALSAWLNRLRKNDDCGCEKEGPGLKPLVSC